MSPFQALYGYPSPRREFDKKKNTIMVAVKWVVQRRNKIDQWLQRQLEVI
jgi:hypothetical protein